MAELWGSLAVDDHVGPRALVAAVLLFDRIVFPVPPEDDSGEIRRWEDNKWDPQRQRRFLDILGVGRTRDDLAVVAPWTPAKRVKFSLLSAGMRAAPGERVSMMAGLEFDSRTLAGADPRHETRLILTREHDAGEASYFDRLPTAVDVEAVIPAYQAADRAVAEFGVRAKGYGEQPGPSASLVGWNLLVPENADWTDATALERAADLARRDDFRERREQLRTWWQEQVRRRRPPEAALKDLLHRADQLNKITSSRTPSTRVLRSFALGGAALSAGGAWFPPVAFAGGIFAAVGLGGEWLLAELERRAAPAAIFTDARKHFGWEEVKQR